MANLFEESDFALFTQYQGKTQKEAPDGHSKLRKIYDKLGDVLSVLQRLGYHTEINRNPLIQGGPATMKYCFYHWSKVYPKDVSHYNGCNGKVFVVIGSTEQGINIHIDSNSRKGYDSDNNKVAKAIKDDTWWQIAPNEAALLSCEELANKVDSFIRQNWIEFNLFAKEFGVQESVEILNKMELEKINKLLLGNYNIVLTGAPGTGKTYLAKEMAKALGATGSACKLVQFHPSYDYTDFVEGLRPVKDGDKLGFERKDGVFKEFCKRALKSKDKASFENLYKSLVEDIAEGKIITYTTITGKVYPLKVVDGVIKYGCKSNGVEYKSENVDNIKLIFEYASLHPKEIEYSFEGLRGLIDKLTNGVIKTLDPSEYSWTIKELLERKKNIPQNYVFIIDEINRGEISKIFGELFYSIDSGYRGTKGRVYTQYQNLVPKDDVFYNGFFIPENVYIIGTMNDIDRSVESMDFAMRRRFAWKEITAESRQSMLDDEIAWGGSKPNQRIIEDIKIRMNNLNACIIDKYGAEELSPKDKIGLTKAYQIGASYFLKLGMYNYNFDELWDNHLKGLLYEYLRGTTNIEAKMARLLKAYNKE